MPDSLDLDDDEKAALIELLRETIERDRFPLSPRVKRLRGILGKLRGTLDACHALRRAEAARRAQRAAGEETAVTSPGSARYRSK